MDNNSAKILIVDDSDSIRSSISSILTDDGYEVDEATNGKASLQMIKQKEYDLILLDVILPDIDGYKICHNLKKNRKTQHIPIIFLTAKRDQQSLQKGFEVGCSDYIPKPFFSEELKVRVHNHIEIKRAKEQLEEELECRKRAEFGLQQSKIELEQAQKIAKLGNWEWQRNSNSFKVSEGFNQIIGTSKAFHEQTMYADLIAFIHPEDQLYAFDRLRNIFFSGMCEVLEFRIQSENVIKWVRIEKPVIKEFDQNGKPAVVIGTVQDVTERKKIESDLIAARIIADKANSAKTDFLANMSHEIRTPLNAILGFSEALFLHSEDTSIKSKLSAINASGKALLTLINNILDLSKVEAGHMELHYENADIRALLSEVAQVFDQKIEETRNILSFHVDEKLPSILVFDEFRLKQILLNLISNAIKFTNNGEITVSVNAKHNETNHFDLVFIVSDSGIGINSSDLKTIFDTFKQQQGQSAKKYGGSGLGLSICKQIIEKWGGTIEASSTVGSGSTFTFTIPNISSAAEMKHIQSKTKQNVVFEKSTVLVIDDNESNFLALQYLLNQEVVQLLYAHDITIALDILKQTKPNLILIDMWLDGIDGVKIAKHFAQNNKLKDIPFVAYTASDNKELSYTKDSLFQGLLMKPISLEPIIQCFTQFLPYHLIEVEEIIAEQSTNKQKITVLEIETLKSLSPTFNDILEQFFTPIHGDLDITAIELFAQKIAQFGNDIDNSKLKTFGENLHTHVGNFEIEKIQAEMNYFGQLINNLEPLKNAE